MPFKALRLMSTARLQDRRPQSAAEERGLIKRKVESSIDVLWRLTGERMAKVRALPRHQPLRVRVRIPPGGTRGPPLISNVCGPDIQARDPETEVSVREGSLHPAGPNWILA